MKTMAAVALLAIAAAGRADEIEPAVATSSAAAVAPAPATGIAQPPRAAGKPAAATRPPAGQKSAAHDQIVLDPTQITGNRELPNVMYVVPWKRPDLGDFAGRPAKSLVDEALAPVDRDVFRRQNRYFAALQAESAARPVAPAGAPAPGATVTPRSGDEK